MTQEVQPCTERNFEDALSVVRKRFGELSCDQLRLLMRNPLRQQFGSVGDIVYWKGKVQGFQAAILRNGYCRKEPFLAVVGSMLAMVKGASPVLLMALMKQTIAPRGGSKLFVSNTAIPVSQKMNRLLGVKGEGLPSCANIRFVVFRWGAFLNRLAGGRLPMMVERVVDCIGRFVSSMFLLRRTCSKTRGERMSVIPMKDIDEFWQRYLATNDGVVLSRSAEELDWAFGSGLASGRNVMLVRRDAGGICGYVVLRSAKSASSRWMIADWIAVNNDRTILSDLLGDAIRHLQRDGKAVFLECIGFRMDVQSVVRKHMPFGRRAKNNSALYKAFDEIIDSELSAGATRGWFFGPYDGDRCIS